ncbi:hypothetical protein BDQ12DRAFT_594672 [Crucibulum laeve]|uniref:BTB domain-containing protein n=1 Tax=Crucibulum laeve TaxID=68775 RepID=A0A5C3MK03_9AGAR|nr:hypothetical protein BDQ12DRAFT_594672 [Crucibulum laeve]
MPWWTPYFPGPGNTLQNSGWEDHQHGPPEQALRNWYDNSRGDQQNQVKKHSRRKRPRYGDSANSEATPKSRKYWFADGSVVFLVAGMRYKLHRYIFEQHSPFFRTLLESYESVRDPPVHISGVGAVDFDQFLGALYPDLLTPGIKFTTAEWISILRLSTRWSFSGLSTEAIKHLSVLISDPVEKLVLGQECAIPEWFSWALDVLCTREEPFTDEEGRRVGLEVVMAVAKERENRVKANRRKESVDGESMVLRKEGIVQTKSRVDGASPALVETQEGGKWAGEKVYTRMDLFWWTCILLGPALSFYLFNFSAVHG